MFTTTAQKWRLVVVRFFPLTAALNPDSAHSIGNISTLTTARNGADKVKSRQGNIAVNLGIEIGHPHIQFSKGY